ncbi:MAG TPA: adenylosuccinate lyase [Candidatus Baltobacteraceae bacterium]|nr:adenylosuccinate lyase [Candidatus Baltobacteraceae bacterium]
MIPRYSRPAMTAIWEPTNRFRIWLKIEVLACEAWAELGVVPRAAVAEIHANSGFDMAALVPRIDEIERRTKHDVVAFTEAIAEQIGPASRYIHLGLTSSDILDTCLAVQMQQAADILLADVAALQAVLATLALQYQRTPTIGRTHGIHAEPTTFGLKLAMWLMEVRRAEERLRRAHEVIGYGKLSGAVGTFANVPPAVEEYVCAKLGLKPEPVSTQIIQRDRHAEYLAAIGVVGSSLDKFATEIRHLQRTEVREAEEPFSAGQKGSSAMPHKRNPVSCEQISGLARLLRSNVQAGLENVALWHERDISHSSVERVILPDGTILLDYLLHRFTEIVRGMRVYPERMQQNLQATHGVIFSQQVLLALAKAGASREAAYEMVQRNAMQAWESGVAFQKLLLDDAEVRRLLTPAEIESCFDLGYHLRHVDAIFRRVGLG